MRLTVADYEQAISDTERRLIELKLSRERLCALPKSLAVATQVEGIGHTIVLVERHIEYLQKRRTDLRESGETEND